MVRFVFLFLGAILLFGHSCTSSKGNSFEDLSRADSLALVGELMDSLRGEMLEYMKEQRKMYLVGMPACGPYYEFKIKLNDKNAITFHDKPSTIGIRKAIFYHFTANRNTSENKNNLPPFTKTYRTEIIEYIESANRQIKDMEKESFPIEMIIFKKNEIIEWNEKLAILSVINSNKLYEVDGRAYVSLYYNSEKQNGIVDSALYAFYDLRNLISLEYFKTSYLETFFNLKKSSSKQNLTKMKALKLFYPVRVYDMPYAERHNLLNKTTIKQPPPILIDEDEGE